VHDLGSEGDELVVEAIDVLPGACPKTQVVQADPFLQEPVALVAAACRLDANRGSTADAIQDLLGVDHRSHSHEREELPVEFPALGKTGDGQKYMSDPVDFDHDCVGPPTMTLQRALSS
jgi:hypothetical protein